MKVVIDIEANGLENPDKIWLIVCKDIETGDYHIFRNLTESEDDKKRFLSFADNVDQWIGHNWLGYDWPHCHRLLGLEINQVAEHSLDTLVLSKLIDYPRQGHSIEDYGIEFGIEKGKYVDFQSGWNQEMEDYCIRDVDICHRVYLKYLKVLKDTLWYICIHKEHKFSLLCNSLESKGFYYNKYKGDKVLHKVTEDLHKLDQDILKAFPPKLSLIREITPKVTKYGTLSKTDFRFIKDGDLSEYNGGPFCRCAWEEFNPSSHKQLIEVLNNAGWQPLDKTQSHIDTERELRRLSYGRGQKSPLDLAASIDILKGKLEQFQKTGWKINENNLSTLPASAPPPARLLAKRILLESRRRTLTEWQSLVSDDGRIHGRFQGIGAWTHRMAHQKPNTANITSEFKEDGTPKLLGKELRSLWGAPKNRLLIGVDAEGIQLRIFAHYINDPEFTKALVEGKKEDKSDAHNLNKRVLGDCCKTRQAAKRFIFALVLGGGIGKLAQILETPEDEARRALGRILERYTGLAYLKKNVIPADAKRGWFVGLDGRKVRIPGDTAGERGHLCMSGYLQNGEALVMKTAAILFEEDLEIAELRKRYEIFLVNIVHDEVQIEGPNNMEVCIRVAKIFADKIRLAGEELGLKCPLAGSYWNDDHHDYTIGTNWYQTH